MATEHEVELTYHKTFFAVAIRHYQRVETLVKERGECKVKTDRDIDHVCALNAAVQREAMVTSVFCALTLEAFINWYAMRSFSRSYFDNHLDKLNPVSKWLIIPKLSAGKQMDPHGQGYECLRETFKLRDKLVHYKSRRKKVSELREGKDWVTERHAQRCIDGVTTVMHELRAIDPEVDISWLDDAQYDPYA